MITTSWGGLELVPVFTAMDPASVGDRLIAAGVIILTSAMFIGLGLALATNYRGIAESLSMGRTERQVRSGTQANRYGGGLFVFFGVVLLTGGLYAAITGRVQINCGYAVVCV